MSELELDLSRNMLGLGGAQILEMCVPDIMSISSLDLSDNGMISQTCLGERVFLGNSERKLCQDERKSLRKNY